jgi:small subunit ribosomal protein S8
MTMQDPIADMLTRLRNTQDKQVNIPHSKIKEKISEILLKEGYIQSFQVIGEVKKVIVIEMKEYYGKPVIEKIIRISKPSSRYYVCAKTVPRFYNGYGVSVLSTSKGIMSDREARSHNIGGEILFKIV